MLLAGAGTAAGAMSRGPECGGGEGDCHRGCLIAGAAPGSRTAALHNDFGTIDPVNTQFV